MPFKIEWFTPLRQKFATPFKGLRNLEITPFIGNKSLRQTAVALNEMDWGFGYGLQAKIRSVVVYGNSVDAGISYETYDLRRIPYSLWSASLAGSRLWGIRTA